MTEANDNRELKRARQACLNCRRKKARCSGEKPVCATCAKLKQQCAWDDSEEETRITAFSQENAKLSNNHLAARLAILESKFSLIHGNTFNDFLGLVPGQSQRAQGRLTRETQWESPSDITSQSFVDAGNGLEVEVTNLSDTFSTLPSKTIIQALIDAYFQYSHNQPYCYFHESTFRQKLDAGDIPEFLMFSILATAVRWSDHDFFLHRHADAIQSYANIAWKQIIAKYLSSQQTLDISMVQATAMLGVIEFTAGAMQPAWVKIGLSVRFAQGLRLNQEPAENLKISEQETRRRTFWSLYVLDRLVSVGPNRPPVFLDDDCTVHLPCHENLFQSELPCEMPTLQNLKDRPDSADCYTLDNFALVVLMASVLGSSIRYCMRQGPHTGLLPWDFRSRFCEITSSLLHFESYSISAIPSVSEFIRQNFAKQDGSINHSFAAHFVFSRALYHLNQCLLHHPFLLHQRFRSIKITIPLTFVQEALQRCRKHACELNKLLQDAREAGYLARTSFYAYCVLTAGVVHYLFKHDADRNVAKESAALWQMALDFLEQEPVRWPHYARMARVLRGFTLEMPTVQALIVPPMLACRSPTSGEQAFWSLVDYGWVSDRASDHGLVYKSSIEAVNKDLYWEVAEQDHDLECSEVWMLTPHMQSQWPSTCQNRNIPGDDIGDMLGDCTNFMA